jgi:hypothetical protein
MIHEMPRECQNQYRPILGFDLVLKHIRNFYHLMLLPFRYPGHVMHQTHAPLILLRESEKVHYRSRISCRIGNGDLSFAHSFSSIMQCFLNVFLFKVGVCMQYFLFSHTICDHTDDSSNGNTKSPDTRDSAHLVRTNCDSSIFHFRYLYGYYKKFNEV